MEDNYGGDNYNGYSANIEYDRDWYTDAESFAENFNYVNVFDADGNETTVYPTYNDIKAVFDDMSNAFTFTDSTFTFSEDNSRDSISFSFDDTVVPSGQDSWQLDFHVAGTSADSNSNWWDTNKILTLGWNRQYEVQSLDDFDHFNEVLDHQYDVFRFYGSGDHTIELGLNEKYAVDSEISLPLELNVNHSNFREALRIYLEDNYGGDNYNGYSANIEYDRDWYTDAESFAENFNYVNVFDADGNETTVYPTYNDIKAVFDDMSNAFTFTDSTFTFSEDNSRDSISFSFDDTVVPSGQDSWQLDFHVAGTSADSNSNWWDTNKILTLGWNRQYEVQSLDDFDHFNEVLDHQYDVFRFYGSGDHTIELGLNEKYAVDSEISLPLEVAVSHNNFNKALQIYLDNNNYNISSIDIEEHSDWYTDAESFAENFNYVNVFDADGNETTVYPTYSDIKAVFDDMSNAFTFTDSAFTFSEARERLISEATLPVINVDEENLENNEDSDDDGAPSDDATWTPTGYEVVTGWLDFSGRNLGIPIETDGAGKYAVMHDDGTNTQYMILTDPTGTPLTEVTSDLGYHYDAPLRTAFVENPDGGGQMLFEVPVADTTYFGSIGDGHHGNGNFGIPPWTLTSKVVVTGELDASGQSLDIPIVFKNGEEGRQFAVELDDGTNTQYMILTDPQGTPLTELNSDLVLSYYTAPLPTAFVENPDGGGPDIRGLMLSDAISDGDGGEADNEDSDDDGAPSDDATWTPTGYEVVTGWLDFSGRNLGIPIETDGAGKYAVMHDDGTNTQYMILTDPTGTPLTEVTSDLGYHYDAPLRTAFVENPDGGGQMLLKFQWRTRRILVA